MNDPEVIKFTNEQIRPIAQKLRNLSAELNAAYSQYNADGGVGAKVYAVVVPTPDDPIEDGREADGVSRLTVNDVYGLMNVVNSTLTVLNNAATTITKPCVRPLSASSVEVA